MSIKLTGNGLWESSRMMITEHKTALIKQRKETNRRDKPVLDEDELLTLGTAISESKKLGQPLTVRMFDEYEDLKVVGIVERIDQIKQQFRVDGEWFAFADVIGIDHED